MMRQRRRHYWLLLAIVVAGATAGFVYRVLPLAGIAVGVGTGAAVLIVLAHLGAFGALIAWFFAARRRSRR